MEQRLVVNLGENRPARSSEPLRGRLSRVQTGLCLSYMSSVQHIINTALRSWPGLNPGSWVPDSSRKTLFHGLLLQPGFTGPWGILGNGVTCEISKQDLESQQHIFGKSAAGRTFRREQARGRGGSENLGEWPGGSMPHSSHL